MSTNIKYEERLKKGMYVLALMLVDKPQDVDLNLLYKIRNACSWTEKTGKVGKARLIVALLEKHKGPYLYDSLEEVVSSNKTKEE